MEDMRPFPEPPRTAPSRIRTRRPGALQVETGVTCGLPMYDENREIPRGRRVDIPEVSGEAEV